MSQQARKYYLELRSGDNLVRPLPKWWRGRVEERINKPHRFTVHLPYDSTLSSELTPIVELWVRDSNLDVVNKFTPRLIDESGPEGYEIKLDCLDIMWQLGREWVSDYTTVEEQSPQISPQQTTKTVSTIISELLSLQSITPAIAIDTIDSAIGDVYTRLDAERMSILAALNELHADVGGYFWVDPDRGFHWVEDVGEALGQQIRLGKNLVNIERRRDFGDMVNRVYAYGGGSGPDTITATVEDSASIASYGLHTGEYFQQRVVDSDVLESHAQSILGHRKEPVISYTVGAVDLSAAAGDEYAFDYLALGNRYRAIDSVLGIDIEVRAVSVTRILDNPTENQVELANQRAQLSDLFVEERRERRAGQAHNSIGHAIEYGGQLDDWITDWNDAEWDTDGLHYDRAGERVNAAGEGDMVAVSFLARLFVGSSLTAINDMAGSTAYPDLAFKINQDFAYTTSDGVLHIRRTGTWEAITADASVPEHMAVLYPCETASTTAPASPIDGDMYLNTTEQQVYKWSEANSEWQAQTQEEGYLARIGDTDDFRIYDGSDWRVAGRVAIVFDSDERPKVQTAIWVCNTEPPNAENDDIWFEEF